MTTPSSSDASSTVRALLDAAQLKPSDDEFESFVKMYPTMRAGADKAYIPEARYEVPALVFNPSWKDLA